MSMALSSCSEQIASNSDCCDPVIGPNFVTFDAYMEALSKGRVDDSIFYTIRGRHLRRCYTEALYLNFVCLR